MAKWRTNPSPVDVFLNKVDNVAIITDEEGGQTQISLEDLITGYRPAGPLGRKDFIEAHEILGVEPPKGRKKAEVDEDEDPI